METYITRQPIMDQNRKVVAYELLYQQDSSVLYNQRDTHVANAIAQFFNDLGHSNFLDGRDAFLTFTPNLLRQEIPHIFDKDKLILQIEESSLMHPETRASVIAYKQKGYRLALLDFDFNPRYFEILPQADFIKIDFKRKSENEIKNIIDMCKKFNIQSMAYHVDDAETREKALAMGVSFFQGESIADMVRTKTRRMDHLQSNFFKLMGEITKEQPDLDEVAKLISVDVTLAFSLMKLVNSAYFSLRHQVKDIKQALTVLGLSQLKQWVYLLSFHSEDGMQDELIRTSFQRATFCQDLVGTSESLQCISTADAYMLGMFSTLDALLEVKMEDALAELSLSDAMNTALIRHEGCYGDLLELCIAYEKGAWSGVERLVERLHVPVNVISETYFKAVDSVNNTWDALQRSADEE